MQTTLGHVFMDPLAAYGAEVDNGKLIGSNFTANWGSVGFFGPLTIHPDYWSQGIAKRLLEPTMQLFSKWNTKHAGLFTFAQSPKHIHFYQKFDFWPRFLTAIMSKEVTRSGQEASNLKWSRYSEEVSERTHKDEKHLLEECGKLTNAVYTGLNLETEILSVKKLKTVGFCYPTSGIVTTNYKRAGSYLTLYVSVPWYAFTL
jgi:hypothetical protein